MRHRMKGRRMQRTGAHRQALLKNLSAALIKHEQIMTTLPKAKEMR
ncbi:MAG: L17 family ribosomal protein, partial [Planctomycetota bacterium]